MHCPIRDARGRLHVICIAMIFSHVISTDLDCKNNRMSSGKEVLLLYPCLCEDGLIRSVLAATDLAYDEYMIRKCDVIFV